MKLIKIENHPLNFAVGHQFDIESTTNESAHANFPDSIQSRVTNGPPPKRHSHGVSLVGRECNPLFYAYWVGT